MALKRPTPPSKKAAAPARSSRSAERIVSIPSDVVIAPQSEPPRQLLGQDRSRQKTKVKELSWAEFDRHVHALARRVREDFKVQAVVGLAHGGVFVGGALAGVLGCEHFPVRLARRSRDTGARGGEKLSGQLPPELKGLRVLVVDDIASSGDTLELAVQQAKAVGAKQVRTATLVTKTGGFEPDYGAFLSDDLVVFPWDYGPVVEDARFDVDPDKAGA